MTAQRGYLRNGPEVIDIPGGFANFVSSGGSPDLSLMTHVRTVGPTGCQFTSIAAALADYVTAVGAGLTSSANQPLVILTNKIIGWSEEAKTGGVAGRVKVRLNKAWIG